MKTNELRAALAGLFDPALDGPLAFVGLNVNDALKAVRDAANAARDHYAKAPTSTVVTIVVNVLQEDGQDAAAQWEAMRPKIQAEVAQMFDRAASEA